MARRLPRVLTGRCPDAAKLDFAVRMLEHAERLQEQHRSDPRARTPESQHAVKRLMARADQIITRLRQRRKEGPSYG